VCSRAGADTASFIGPERESFCLVIVDLYTSDGAAYIMVKS